MKNRRTRNRNSSRNNARKIGVNSTVLILGAVSAIGVAAVGANVASIIRVATTTANTLVSQINTEAQLTNADITTGINTFSTTTVQSINSATNNFTDAIKVATAQESASGQALAEASTRTAQKEATARATIHMQDVIIRNYKNFSGKSGQGYKACTVVAENKGLDAAQAKTKNLAAGLEASSLNAITMSSDLTQDLYSRHNITSNEFCPTGSTYCTPSTTLPGGDLNATLLFTPAAPGSKEKLGRTLYREHILGINQQAPLTTAQANSPMGQKAYFESNRQASLLSPAAYSLAHIDAQNTKTIKRDDRLYSANELIDSTVSKYYGGAEAKEWQASMLTQEPRGLLVEAARLGGLGVWLNNEMYQQSLRKEANLAAILIATAQPLSDNVQKKGSDLEATSIRNISSLYK